MMEFCPGCNQLSNVNSSISHSTENKKEIITTSFHCENCGSFIRSESNNINVLHKPYKKPRKALVRRAVDDLYK